MASTNKEECLMVNGLLGKFWRRKNNVQHQIVKDKTVMNKYSDPECNLYRYSKFNYYSDKFDELYELIEGFHTIPGHKDENFEEAASKSISFKANHKIFVKKLLIHQLLTNPSKGTKGSTYKHMFDDGSLFTKFSSYRNNSRQKKIGININFSLKCKWLYSIC